MGSFDNRGGNYGVRLFKRPFVFHSSTQLIFLILNTNYYPVSIDEDPTGEEEIKATQSFLFMAMGNY